MTTKEFRSRIRKRDSNLGTGLSEHDKQLIKDALSIFWEFECGLTLWNERCEDALNNGEKINILFTDVYLDEITGINESECYERFGANPTFQLQVNLDPERFLLERELRNGSRFYYDSIDFGTISDMVEYLVITSECELMEIWSDKIIDKIVNDLSNEVYTN